MGMRCQRFSMLVDDGVVKTLNVEAPGKFEVSTRDTMLKQLGLNARSCARPQNGTGRSVRSPLSAQFAVRQLRCARGCRRARSRLE